MTPYLDSIYNNTFDPVNNIFYMHYGYGNGSSNQTGYSTQVYEKWIFAPFLKINSFYPKSGTTGTPITIYGVGFSNVTSTYQGVAFGNYYADSINVISDSVMVAWVGVGSSGKVLVNSTIGTTNYQDTLSGFTYIPLPPITNSGWRYVDKPGFSQNAADAVSAAVDSHNVPYVVYRDKTNSRITVMSVKNNAWYVVGGTYVVNVKSLYPTIIIDKNDMPIVTYLDSVNPTNMTIKRFNGRSWGILSAYSFTGAASNYAGDNNFNLALDSNNVPYIAYTDGSLGLNLIRFNGSTWDALATNTGTLPTYDGNFDFTIDKNTNTPYVVYTDPDSAGKASVAYLDTTLGWTVLGSQGFSTGKFGAFYPRIAMTKKSAPVVAFQDDNGFERASMFIYQDSNWAPVGYPRFTKAHIYWPSLALDKNDQPYLLYDDATYNARGTVSTFTDSLGWQPVGSRGFESDSTSSPLRHALFIDTANNPAIAYSDRLYGGKVSVMVFGTTSTLPLKLVAFQAFAKNGNGTIVWQTFQEPNSGIYEVERSFDGLSFETIGHLTYKGSNVNNYQFIDYQLPTSGKIFYRLKIVNENGSFTYSNVVTVNINDYAIFGMVLYPNPAKEQLSVKLQGKTNGSVTMSIVDLQGRVVKQEFHVLSSGTNTIQIATESLPKGRYVLITRGDINTQSSFIRE